MLAEITIRNFAIIDRLDVEFETGMTVLSGETGAGKSILVDALNLILGDRADAGVHLREAREARRKVGARQHVGLAEGERHDRRGAQLDHCDGRFEILHGDEVDHGRGKRHDP